MITTLGYDRSWDICLSTDVKPTEGKQNRDVLLEVDTALWYVYYEGTWYVQ